MSWGYGPGPITLTARKYLHSTHSRATTITTLSLLLSFSKNSYSTQHSDTKNIRSKVCTSLLLLEPPDEPDPGLLSRPLLWGLLDLDLLRDLF